MNYSKYTKSAKFIICSVFIHYNTPLAHAGFGPQSETPEVGTTKSIYTDFTVCTQSPNIAVNPFRQKYTLHQNYNEKVICIM